METIVPDTLKHGQRLAVLITEALGCWGFIIGQSLVLAWWVVWNGAPTTAAYHFDAPPYILLNLMLSFQAAFTGPIVLMAQNVAAIRDRLMVEMIRAEVHKIRTDLEELRAEHHEMFSEHRQMLSEMHQLLIKTTAVEHDVEAIADELEVHHPPHETT